MKWTNEPPTEPGWYFYQRIDGDYPIRVGFVAHKTYTARWSMDLFETLTLFKHPYEEFGTIIAEITVPMRWAGPIPEPEEEDGH